MASELRSMHPEGSRGLELSAGAQSDGKLDVETSRKQKAKHWQLVKDQSENLWCSECQIRTYDVHLLVLQGDISRSMCCETAQWRLVVVRAQHATATADP